MDFSKHYWNEIFVIFDLICCSNIGKFPSISEVMKESNQCSTKYVSATKFGRLVVASDLIFYQPVDGVVADGVNVLWIPLGLDCLFLGKFGCSCLWGYGDGFL